MEHNMDFYGTSATRFQSIQVKAETYTFKYEPNIQHFIFMSSNTR